MSKLNIKEEMQAIGSKDRRWYDSLTEEEKRKCKEYEYTFKTCKFIKGEYYGSKTSSRVNLQNRYKQI